MSPTYLEQLRRANPPSELAFDQTEYAGRLAIAQAELDRRDIDVALLQHLPSICYLSGYQSPATSDFGVLAVPRAGAPVLQLVDHEVSNAVLTSWVQEIRSFSWYQPETILRQTIALVRELAAGRSRFTLGLEFERSNCTAATVHALSAAFPAARLVDVSDVLDQQRVIKSEREIAYLRSSAAITLIGIEAALDAIRPGCTDNDLAAAGFAAMIAAGSEYPSTQPFVATGVRSSMVHTTFKRRPVFPGETIFLEFASSFQRYSAPMMRSAVLGPPSPTVERLLGGVQRTLSLLLENIAPGRTAHEVAQAASRGFEPMRDEIYFQGAYGYHVGLSLPPNWWEGLSPYIAEGVHEELRPGMVFHLPVAARIPGLGGVALSETVLVTSTGCDMLTAPQRDLRVVPLEASVAGAPS